MTKILMVCLGNICRSPLAEGILKAKLPKNTFLVESAGTANYHAGLQPDSRSIEVANNYGIDISHQRARQFVTSDFDKFDYIYAMDSSNFENIMRVSRNDNDSSKVKLILNELPHVNICDVPDPYYGGNLGFDNVFLLLEEACNFLSNKLTKNE